MFRNNDNIAKAIQCSTNSYFLITSRTNLGKLNFSLNAVKELKIQNNGIAMLENYVKTSKKENIRNTELQSVVIEDSGKAREWFKELFKNKQLEIEYPNKHGKEQVCNLLEYKLRNTNGIILTIFDECSFGSCIKKFKGIIDEFNDRVLILSNYKSWE